MATRHLYGDARIDYVAPGGIPVEHLLGAKLIELAPADVHFRRDWWAMDEVHQHVVTAASPVHDLLATIRYDDDPGALKRMLRFGLRGTAWNYRETAAGVVYPLRLVHVVGASATNETPIRPDRHRWRLGEYEARIHIRRTDGGTLDGLL